MARRSYHNQGERQGRGRRDTDPTRLDYTTRKLLGAYALGGVAQRNEGFRDYALDLMNDDFGVADHPVMEAHRSAVYAARNELYEKVEEWSKKPTDKRGDKPGYGALSPALQRVLETQDETAKVYGERYTRTLLGLKMGQVINYQTDRTGEFFYNISDPIKNLLKTNVSKSVAEIEDSRDQKKLFGYLKLVEFREVEGRAHSRVIDYVMEKGLEELAAAA